MKGLRPLLVSGVSIAIALTGLIGGRAEAAGNAAPTSMSVVPSATTVFEGDLLTLTVRLDSPATEQTRVEVNWGDPSMPDMAYLNAGATELVFGHPYMDDMPGTTPDLFMINVTAANATTVLVNSVTVTVKNAPPVFTSLTVSPSSIMPGESATVTGTFTDAGSADRHTVTVDWGEGTFQQFKQLIAHTYTFSYSFIYPAAGTYTITAGVTDDDKGYVETTVDLAVGATNASPSDLHLAMSPVAEGGSSTLTAGFTDPDPADTHFATVNWGDNSGVDALPTLAAGVASFTPAHTYKDTGTYTVTVVLNDSAGHSITGTTSVIVSNVAPVVSLTAPASPIAGDNLDLGGTFTDPGTLDTFSLSVDWGDGTAVGTPVLGADGRSFTASHTYAVEGSYAAAVVVTDRDGGPGSASATVVVRHRNVAPTGLTLNVPPVAQGAMTTLTGAFSDTDPSDAHSVVINWGDATPPTTLSLAPGVTTFTTTHGYVAAGTWTVSATASDQAAASASTSTFALVTAPATTTAALLDRLTVLVQSFDLDPYSERWAMRRLDQLKSSLVTGTANFCDALRGLDRLTYVARHTLTGEQIAALSALTAKLQAAAHCPTNEDETGEHGNAVLPSPQTPTTPTAPKVAPKEDANKNDQKNNEQNNNDKNKNAAVTPDKGKQTNSQSGNSTNGARSSRANN